MSGITRVAESELVVPRGFVIDEIAIDRLHAQLTRQPPEVTAVVAPIGDAPPGSSFRTVAQRAALQPPSRAFVTDEPHDGVALVRAGVEFELVGPRVRVAQGQILLDPGAASYDAEAPIGAFERAAAEGRSPFPRAPLVLFVGLEPESGRAIWARDLVNRLLDHGIEARLATVSEPDPPHLTRPCRPEAETVRALGPDVIVTLDDSALAIAPSWCERRSTVVVHHTGERTLATELVSWRLGVASGRVRAFIGSAVDAPTLAALCSRLCSGPFPAPPQPERDDEGDRVTRVRAPGPSLRVAVVHGSSGATPRLASFLSEAKAQGAITETFGPSDASTATDHHVVILAHDLDAAAGLELVKQRERRGLKTVVDVVVPTTSTTLAERCGRATASARDSQSTLEERGITVRVLPSLLTRSRLDELQRARRATEEDESVILGLVIDAGPSKRASAAMYAVSWLLDEDPTLAVELLSPVEPWSAGLRSHPRATMIGDGDTTAVARWRAQAWVGSAPSATDSARPRPLVEAAYLGIPTVFAADGRGDVDDELVGRWALSSPEDPNQWFAGLHACLEPTTDHSPLARRSDLLFGAKAGMSIVNRILGWASFAEPDR